MTPERYSLVKGHFLAAIDREGPERADYLSQIADAELRADVLRLLAESEGESGFHLSPEDDGAFRTSDPAKTELAAEKLPREIGPYRIVRTIGRGGMGRVYEAEQTQPRRRVALKVVRSGISSEKALQRFRLEAEILGRLEHEGIARIFEGGSAEGPDGVEPFIAMELIDGLPLDQYVANEKPSVNTILGLLARIAEAVAHAHRRGIIHRDLKPGNILVHKDGRPKIVDFGVSRLSEGDSSTWFGPTETGQLLGTLVYMSPEQASGEGGEVDTRSDVYALGVIAYQLIAGFLPGRLPRTTFTETIDAIRHEIPEPLDRVRKRLDRDVAVIVHHALKKEKDRRYPSAEAFAEDIRRYLANEPIVARPESAIYQISRFARRHRILVAGVCATILAVAVGFFSTVRQKRMTEDALFAVESEKRKAIDEKSTAERARDEATAARAEAQERLDDSRAVQRFLELVIGAARAETIGRNVTVVDAMTWAEGHIKSQFGNRPRIEATVRTALGKTRRSLGDLKSARADFETALRLCRENPSGTDAMEADILGLLGGVHYAMNDFETAEEMLEDAEDVWKKIPGAERDVVARDQAMLAATRAALGRPEQALSLYRKAIENYRAAKGPRSAEVAVTSSNLGILLAELQNYDDAEAAYRETLSIYSEIGRSESVDAAVTRHNLAQVLITRNQLEEAETLLRAGIAVATEKFGPNHAIAVRFKITLASLLSERKCNIEARQVAEEALKVLESAAEPDPIGISCVYGVLSKIAGALGDYDTEVSRMKSAAETIEKGAGPSHNGTMTAKLNLIGVLYRRHRFIEALIECEALETSIRAIHAENEAIRGSIEENFGRIHLALGNWDASLRRYQRAVEVKSKSIDDGAPEMKHLLEQLVTVYALLEKQDEAKAVQDRIDKAQHK